MGQKKTFLFKPSSYKNLSTTKPIKLWNRKMKEQSYVMYIWGCKEECVSCLQGYQQVSNSYISVPKRFGYDITENV